jgi:hypothetical protein
MKIQVIRCRHCGDAFTGEEKTLPALRKRARESGWRVGVPLWATVSPAVSKETYWATHPGSKGKTVDSCARCSAEHSIESQRKALNRMREEITSKSPTHIM